MGNTVEVVRLSDFDDMAIPACKNSSKVVIGALAEKRFYSTTNSSIVGWNLHVAGSGLQSVSMQVEYNSTQPYPLPTRWIGRVDI